jgi:hypothetical protein
MRIRPSGLAVSVFIAAACAESEPPRVEVGLADADGAFMAFGRPGECPLIAGPEGVDTARVALRVPGPWSDAEVRASVSIDGVPVGAAPPTRAGPFVAAPDGGFVWDGLILEFTEAPCCLACREADVDVEVRDRDGGTMRGGARVRFTRGLCPECCGGADAACGLSQPDDCAAPLEIGERGADGVFHAWRDGQDIRFVLAGGQGLPMIQPSLRAAGIDPGAPAPRVEVRLGDWAMGAALAGSRTDMEPDGAGWVLPSLTVPFSGEACCFICRDVYVSADLIDRRGRRFAGTVRVRLTLGECPMPGTCCASDQACYRPSLAQVCP